jgi:hypothetical protein
MGTQGLDPVSIEASALLRAGELPRFDLFETDQVVPAIRQLLGELASALDALEARVEPTWEGLVLPLERMNERLAYAWGLVSHMLAVRNSDALRTAHETVQGEVIAFGLRQAQSPAIHDGLQRLRGGPAFAALDATQQRIVDCLLRDARHSGVGLEPAKRARFNAIQAELAQLATRFNNHVLDATRAFSILVRDPAEMAGTPPSLRALTAQNARENGEPDATAESGPWRLSLDAPVLIPFLEHGASRPLRERLYRANIGRAASGELDNTPVLEGILALRQEMARLLGFASYAELSLDAKMAPGLSAVDELLDRLRLASIPGARADLASVQAFAAEGGQREPVALWDVPYWAERLREQRFAYTDEELRPYFPLPEGARRALRARETALRRPHRRRRWRDARSGTRRALLPRPRRRRPPIAAFFLDPYSRPADKRGGAWMDDCSAHRLRRRARACVCRSPISSATSRRRSASDPVADDLPRGRDALPRVRPRPAAHADHASITVRRGHQQRRVGRGRAAEPVHGELVLPPPTLLGLSRHVADRRAAAPTSSSRRSGRAHLPRGQLHAASALLRDRLDLALHHATPGASSATALRRAARDRGAHDRVAAAARGSLPLQLLPHLRGRLRGRLLQLQVGRGVVSADAFSRLRGGRSRRIPPRCRAPVAASATRCSRWAGAATRCVVFEAFRGRSRPPTRCCGTRGRMKGCAASLGAPPPAFAARGRRDRIRGRGRNRSRPLRLAAAGRGNGVVEARGRRAQEQGKPGMIKLAIDFENPGREWWDNGGRELWESITEGFDNNDVAVDESIADSWLAEAARIPGWTGGPEFAPHPICKKAVDEDEIV